MAATIITGIFAILLFCFVVWRKIKQHPSKQSKSRNTNKQGKSIEELRQHESRFRGQGGGRGM